MNRLMLWIARNAGPIVMIGMLLFIAWWLGFLPGAEK